MADATRTTQTTVLRDLLPGWQASEWHMQRGRAVHACCAMLARGEQFEHDPQIDNQVKAARLWFEFYKPEVLCVETPMGSRRYQFAGMPDLVARIDGVRTVIDWKASLAPGVPYQLAAYAILYGEHAGCGSPTAGQAVVLRDEGQWSVTPYDLKPYGRKFLAMLTTYNVRRECGIKEERA